MSIVERPPAAQPRPTSWSRPKDGSGLLATLAKWSKTAPLSPHLTRHNTASTPSLPTIPERPAPSRTSSAPTTHTVTRTSSGVRISTRPAPTRTPSGLSTISEIVLDAPSPKHKRPVLNRRESGSWEKPRKVHKPSTQSEALRLENVPKEWSREKISRMCAQFGRLSLIDMACDGDDPPGSGQTVRVFFAHDWQAAVALESLQHRFKTKGESVTVKWDKWWAC